MVKFSILSLFPEVIEAYCSASIIGRAQSADLIQVDVTNPRDYTTDAHKKVDDSPYGGGSGMVMMCQPLDDAYQSLLPLERPSQVLLTSPTGRVFDQAWAKELAGCQQIVLISGHYEGIDHRLHQLIPEIQEVSLGDFVLTGGELPALCIVDAVSRMVPGVVQKFSSVEADSFYHGLLDHPHYTRPAEYKGLKVPDVLMSGNHAEIETWRRRQALEITWRQRPELLRKCGLSEEEENWINQLQ